MREWEASSENLEGAPTLSYELWRYHETWHFVEYRLLSLRQVLRYEEYGYTVRRLVGHRSDTLPLFPLLGSTGQYPTDRLD